jgi:hypothetical protein
MSIPRESLFQHPASTVAVLWFLRVTTIGDVNRHGGDASILHVPDIGVFGRVDF